MAQLQSLGEALSDLFGIDPECADVAMDYLADLGRLDAVIGEGLVIL